MNIPINIPDGQSGNWKVETKIVTEKEETFGQFRAIMNGHGRYTPAGKYKGLLRNDEVIMSNTPDEIMDHYPLKRNAHGQVLINGLGLGMCIEMIIDQVFHIIVIEKSQDVINLVGPYYKDNPKVFIIHADAFDYKPPKGFRYNAVWHDIWDGICTDIYLK